MARYSVSPAGEKFLIPEESDWPAELDRLTKLVEQARDENKEIVVVMGVGFVGAVMAAIIADTVDKTNRQAHQVRDWLPTAQHTQLLENSLAPARRISREGGRPRSRSDSSPAASMKRKP